MDNKDGQNWVLLLNSMTTVVPVPAAAWLFASALATLLTRRKIKAN
jgi:hypothetical protein